MTTLLKNYMPSRCPFCNRKCLLTTDYGWISQGNKNMIDSIIQTLTKSLRILWENAPTKDKIIILEKLKEEIDKKLETLYGNNGG